MWLVGGVFEKKALQQNFRFLSSYPIPQGFSQRKPLAGQLGQQAGYDL